MLQRESAELRRREGGDVQIRQDELPPLRQIGR